MIILKNEREQAAMRVAGAMTAAVLDAVCRFIRPGLTTKEVELFTAEQIRAQGGRSAFLGYRGYPCQLCISVNEEVVHGMAGSRRLQFGDLVSLDVGVSYHGFIGDTARTVAVGGCSPLAQKLMDVTERALEEGIARAVPGNRVVDISRAIQQYVESNGFSVVREFVGHGVGRTMHEEPQVPNFVDGKKSPPLRPGMTIAIEPMVNAGKPDVQVLGDGWTAVAKDGSMSAHFEHTVAVTATGARVLTD